VKLLQVENVFSGYGRTEIIHGFSLYVNEGEIVAVIGPNGAGKSTLLKTIMGYLKPTRGDILFKGESILDLRTDEIANKKIGYFPQENNVFSSLTVEENLQIGGYIQNTKETKEKIEEVYEIFPVLSNRKRQKGGTLSGGERQMLALGRVLMAPLNFLLIDELSAGLAPLIVLSLFDKLKEIHKKMGIGILLVEQNVEQSLRISERVYVISLGYKESEGTPDEVRDNNRINKAYLGG